MSTKRSKKKAKTVPSLHIHSPRNGVTSVSISGLTEDGRRVKATTVIAKLPELEPEPPLRILSGAEIFSEDAPPIEIHHELSDTVIVTKRPAPRFENSVSVCSVGLGLSGIQAHRLLSLGRPVKNL